MALDGMGNLRGYKLDLINLGNHQSRFPEPMLEEVIVHLWIYSGGTAKRAYSQSP